MTAYRPFAFLLAALIALWAPATQAQHTDIVDTAVEAGSFTTLATALEAAGLIETLKGDGPFTVFAPTDDAFAKLPKGTVETLLRPENRDQLVALLTYHVVSGRVPASQAKRLDAAPTVNGQRLDLAVRHGALFIDAAQVVSADIRASNGIIHVIDEVLMPVTQTIPEVAQEAGSFATLLAAAQAAGLAQPLAGDGPFTVFAPTDDAFAALPDGTVETLLQPGNRDQLAAILSYHVVPGRLYAEDVLQGSPLETLQGDRLQVRQRGGAVRVNDATVQAANVEAANGVIHVIDAVLLPEGAMGATMDAATAPDELIRLAIRKGAPLYNSGQPAACAAVYQVTANALLARADVPEAAKTPLRRALRTMTTESHAGQQAWTLRYGLDDALAALDRSTMRTAAH